MRLVITGASGFIAQEIVPLFLQRGVVPILISARCQPLRERFPDLVCDSYDNLPHHLAGAEGVLHLAAKNNDTEGTLAEFREENVEKTLSVLDAAKTAGVPYFIFTSSFHTLALGGPQSDYARSKAEAEIAISSQSRIDVSILHMPAVYGSTFKGKLAILNRLPVFVQKLSVGMLAALKPVVNVSRIADRVTQILKGEIVLPNYLSDPAQENAVYVVAKRILDLAFMLAVVVLAGWLMVIVWLMIKLDSPGPGVFKQERVGKNGKTFTCFKFRTMRQGIKQAGTHELSPSSVTRFGHFLRKTKIDELPQIINIMYNEVSLIGPRPCLPSQLKLIEERSRLGVFSVKPGISGLAQVQNIDMSEPSRLALVDASYVAQQSILLDLKILLLTLSGSGQGDKIK